MREFRDKGGHRIELLSLHLEYLYEGLIEGSRQGANFVYRREIERALKESRSLFIVGFSEPERKVEERWSDEDRWPPEEEVTVRCRSRWVPKGKHPHGHTTLTIKWYQDDGDPFEYLARALRRIEWEKYATYVELLD